MKSTKLWAGVVAVALLSFAPFAFGQAAASGSGTHAGLPVMVPASLLIVGSGPRGGSNNTSNNSGHTSNFGGGGWGGGGNGGGGNGGGCGQGGNGGWGGSGNGGWGGGGNGGWGGGGNGGNGGCVPEGGNSLGYLALGALACAAAMSYRSHRQDAACATK